MSTETGFLDPSEHFSYAQMVKPDLVTSPEQQANLIRLCEEAMEAVRSLLSVPPEVIKGLDMEDPEHAEGLACDFRAPGWPLHEAAEAVRGSLIPYRVVRLEEGPGQSWHIHLAL